MNFKPFFLFYKTKLFLTVNVIRRDQVQFNKLEK